MTSNRQRVFGYVYSEFNLCDRIQHKKLQVAPESSNCVINVHSCFFLDVDTIILCCCKIDVYSFGMLLFHLFTFIQPFGKISRPLRAYLKAEMRPEMLPKVCNNRLLVNTATYYWLLVNCV